MTELRDDAQIFVGETAEGLADLEYAVMRDPARLEHARAEMAAAMRRVIADYTARERKRRTNGRD